MSKQLSRRELLKFSLVAGAGAMAASTGLVPRRAEAHEVNGVGSNKIKVLDNTSCNIETEKLGAAFRPGVSDLSKGKYPGFGYSKREKEGILIEKDVPIVMRDGKKLYANVYRPKDQTDVPAIICFAPFGKHPHIDMKKTFTGSGVPFEKLSDETIFEVFDPMKWGKDGYAIVTVDGPGNWSSEGTPMFFSPEEARAGYDTVEYVSQLDWCSGKVGWGAVSYYAMSAWEVAALNPPHLAAIMPWEGASDVYNECYFHGGIPTFAFNHNWQHLVSFSKGKVEDMEAAMRNHPLMDDYWRSKIANWEKITIPTYAVTDWANDLHLRGTIEAWKNISSNEKFLDIHGGKEWQDFYGDWAYKRQKSFFDYYLKGVSNDLENWSKVRVAERDNHLGWKFREENEFPLQRTQYHPLYLNADNSSASFKKVHKESSTKYVSTERDGQATFDIKFDRRIEMTGYTKLRLWVAATGTNDADLFVALDKLDKNGNKVNFAFSQMFNDGPAAVGWLRVSHRELDSKLSTPERPVLKHSRNLWLTSNEPVPVDIEIWPTSIIFDEGESLRVIVKGTQISNHPGSGFEIQYGPLHNAGEHVIYTGGQYDSHLLMPVIA